MGWWPGRDPVYVTANARTAVACSAPTTTLTSPATPALTFSHTRQSAFEAADYNPNSVTGQDAFDRLQTALESKVAARTAAVNAIHAAASAAEASAGGQSDTAPQCCSTPTTDNDYVQEFRAPVLLDSTCNRFPYSEEHADAAMQTTAGKTVGLLDTYESNFATTPELKWQYYGSDTGAFRVFPAKDRGSCCDYDVRVAAAAHGCVPCMSSPPAC